jgi:ferric-dicitrate binding protein FerR (iron transport regulator)
MSEQPSGLPPKDIELVIIKFLQEEATPEETALLENWLGQDERHREQFREINKTFQVAVKLPQFNPKRVDTAWDVFADKISAEHKTRERSLFSNSLWIRIAASISILLMAGVVWWTYFRQDTPSHAFIQNARNEKTKIVLPDSSIVWLNANSSLEYDADFGEVTRDVNLKGEAYFDVTKSQKEFVVNTDNISIHVKGTRFNVSTLRNGNEETTLEEGRVILKVKGTVQSYDLKPGDQVTFNKVSNKVLLQQVKASDYTVWKEDTLLLENLSLGDIILKLEKRFNVEIALDSAIGRRENLTMSIHDETIEDVLELVKLSTSLNYKIKGNQVTLYE